MFSNFQKIIFSLILVFGFLILFDFKISAQEENLADYCQLEKIEENCEGIDASECRKILEKCESYYQQESARIEKDITKTEAEKKTLQNKISSLSKQIKNLDYQISQSNIVIKDLKLQINDTQNSIEKTSLKIDDKKEKLSGILRVIYEEDQKGTAEILLSGGDLSNFFDNLVALEILNSKNQELLKEIKGLKTSLETQKASLDGEKTDLEKVVQMQTLQKQASESTKKSQEGFLKLTETQYQKYLKEKEEAQKKAQEIRSRIFELIGVPEAPTFGEALEIANLVSAQTGVRQALLLAVLTQESNIGKNVGQCYLRDSKTGDGVTVSGKTIQRIMKPSRDVQPFLNICQELGRDPYNTPVSCPIASIGGYGGAMGPAQFIPSTWVLFKDRISAVTGKPSDPWNIRDAFLAAALYLKDNGAASQNYNDEWRAAMIYFAGTVNKKYRFYGDSVMSIAQNYENDIAALKAGN